MSFFGSVSSFCSFVPKLPHLNSSVGIDKTVLFFYTNYNFLKYLRIDNVVHILCIFLTASVCFQDKTVIDVLSMF